MKTGAELKARREELKITQQDLADKIGVSRTQLSRMENGKIEISSDIYMKIEAVLTSNEEYKEPELTINDIQVGDELECIDRDGFINGSSPRTNKNILEHPIIISHFGEYGAYLTIEYWLEENELKYFRKKPKLQFSDLEVGDYVYVRDDLEHAKWYGSEMFYENSMLKGRLIRIGSIVSRKIFCDGFNYTKEMLDLSRSMKKEDYLKMNEKEIASFEELQYVANKALDESIIEKYEVCIGSYGNKNMIIHFDGKFTEYSDNSTNSGIEFIQSLYTEEFVIECEDDIKRIKVNAEIEFKNGNKDIVDGIINDGKEIQISEKNQYGALGIFILKGATVKQSK